MSIHNWRGKKNPGKNTDQIAISGNIIELIYVENLSTQMKDKKIRKTQHRFTKIKLCGASLTAICDGMASLVNGGEQWISIYFDLCRMTERISHILIEADWTGWTNQSDDGWKSVSSAEITKSSLSQTVNWSWMGFLRVFKNSLGDGTDYTSINFSIAPHWDRRWITLDRRGQMQSLNSQVNQLKGIA